MKRVRPKKALGQHFLRDLSIAERIAATVDSYHGTPLLEVGPGMGVLTRFLIEAKHDLSVVEIDRESIAYLKSHFPMLEGRIIEDDFLQLDLAALYSDSFSVIGNFPYHISSQIFFKILEYRDQAVCCAGMIQKEVAERLAAVPGKKSFGVLSALIQPWYDVEYLFTVGAEVFDPPPKVQSAVVRMTRNGRKRLGCDEALYKQLVKMAFNQRRKTLRNSLKRLLGDDYPHYQLPIFGKRPEQLGVESLIELTLMAEAYLKQAPPPLER